jgi:large subunit ribosomal protein L22
MESKIAKVKVKDIAQSPQKLRLVADLVRGKDVTKALDILAFANRKGTKTISKAIESGIANAREKYGVEKSELKISHISVDEAATFKRARFASRGRYARILKRRAHLNLELIVK